MSNPKSSTRRFRLHPSIPRPAFQRQYTTTPSHWRACTPAMHHGFIDLHTSTPGQTPESHEHQSTASRNDYFFARGNSSMLSPDSAPYEAHGFLPLCSVAAVGEYAKDYFSVSTNQTSTAMKAPFETFESPVMNATNESGIASASTARFPEFMYTSHLSLNELAHPTGSPVHERDITPIPARSPNSEDGDIPMLRGGGGEYFYEKEQEGCEEIRDEREYPKPSTLNDPASETITTEEIEQTANTQPLIATYMTEKRVQGAEKLAEVKNTVKKAGDHVRNAGTTHRTTGGSKATRQFPSSAGDIERLLREIAAVFPNAALKFASSEAHANNPDGESHTSSMNNNDSSTGAEDVLSTSSRWQYESDQPAHLNDTSLKIQPFPLVEFDSIPPETTMDDAALGRILPKPLSPRPPSTRRRKKKPYKPLSPINNNFGGLFDIAQRSTAKELAFCRSGMKFNIMNATTREVYVRKVPVRMLWHFCGASVLERLGDVDRVDTIKIPAEEAEKSGITRVVRYMRRACTAPIVRPTGELRIPGFSISAGIETIRACRIFGLESDAWRIEKLMVHSWMGNRQWYMTDEHVQLIWEGYHGLLRETALGDAIVWFILNEVQSGSHPLAVEIRWMLDQEEYESLKARVHDENSGIRKRWRHESRKQYLERCRAQREQKQQKEEERTGARPRLRAEPRRVSLNVEETKTSLERHRSNSTMFPDLDEDAPESDVSASDVSQTSSLRRRSGNSRPELTRLVPCHLQNQILGRKSHR